MLKSLLVFAVSFTPETPNFGTLFVSYHIISYHIISYHIIFVLIVYIIIFFYSLLILFGYWTLNIYYLYYYGAIVFCLDPNLPNTKMRYFLLNVSRAVTNNQTIHYFYLFNDIVARKCLKFYFYQTQQTIL